MKKCIALFFMLLFVFISLAQQKSSIDFTIKNIGINVNGHFNIFSISARFDSSDDLEYLEGRLKVASIETGIDSRDTHLLEEDYFHASKYPIIKLQTIGVKRKAANKYTAKVSLNIKKKEEEITIPLWVEKSKSSIKITSEFKINRRDFDIGGRSLVMQNEVKISVVYCEKIK